MMTAYEEGYSAFVVGNHINPHPTYSIEYAEWRKGYVAAKTEYAYKGYQVECG